jgi:hypothetical protein
MRAALLTLAGLGLAFIGGALADHGHRFGRVILVSGLAVFGWFAAALRSYGMEDLRSALFSVRFFVAMIIVLSVCAGLNARFG